MTKLASECRLDFPVFPFLRRSLLLVAMLSGPALWAQLSLTQTFSVPHSIDGESIPVFFDLSSPLVSTDAVISHTRLSIDFSKIADLFDEPPFYSDMGFLLRKLDSSFSVISEITLLNVGGFQDGSVSTFFDGVITFDDDASVVINQDPEQPTSGLFRAVEPLSLLNGIYSPYWELRIVDAALQSPILFHSATLTTTVFPAVPEPASVGVLGACLIGLLALRRHSAAA